jgi:hypothetical protein
LPFVLDGMAAEVSFELPPARFSSFLDGEPNAFPFVAWRRLLLAPGILGVLAGDECDLEFMVVRGRERKEIGLPNRGLERRTKDGLHERKAGEKAKKTLREEKAVTLVKVSLKTELTKFPTFPHFSAFVPSGLVLPFCGFDDCCSRSRE